MGWKGGGVPGGLLWGAPGWLSCATAEALPPFWCRHSGKKSPRSAAPRPAVPTLTFNVAGEARRILQAPLLRLEGDSGAGGEAGQERDPPPGPDCGGLPRGPSGRKSEPALALASLNHVLGEGGLPLTPPPRPPSQEDPLPRPALLRGVGPLLPRGPVPTTARQVNSD